MGRIFTPKVIATIVGVLVCSKVMRSYGWPWYEALAGQAALFALVWYVIPGTYELVRLSSWSTYARERLLLTALLGIILCCLAGASFAGRLDRWLNTIGVLTALAVPLQAYISGFFGKLEREFANEKRHPGGPSGPYAKEVIRSSETPILNWVEAKLFMDSRTSLFFMFASALLTIASGWIAP